MYGKLHYPVQTKHRLLQYHEERIFVVHGYHDALSVYIDCNGCAVLICFTMRTKLLLTNRTFLENYVWIF